MKIQDFVKMLRSQWITVCVAVTVAVLGAVALTLLTTPLYQASTRLYVSAAGGASVAEMYQGNRLSQERVISYTELIMGETLAQRTIDKLGLDMEAETLRQHVKASAKPDTVLVDVDVLDESPVRARDIANALSDEFVSMVRELETPEDGSRPDARVVVEQRASLPTTPASPNWTLNLLAGLAIGLLAGTGLAILRGSLDNTVKDRESLEEMTGVGLVGSIPLDKERRTEPAISFGSDNSAIAEAFRKLRTNLQFLAVDHPPRVIVVTSSMPSEGKSTTAINIALALAEADHSVVLVDGDMRRPKLNEYLGLVGTVGLSTVLSGRASLSEVLQATKYPGLTVLTSGGTPPNPSELLGSLAAKKVLSELRAKFDFVIVDSSPLLAVTDAAILAAGSDGVLIMARFGQTKRDQLQHAVGNLEDVGARVLGAVFTMTPDRGSSSYSYSYYGDDASSRSRRAATPVESQDDAPTRAPTPELNAAPPKVDPPRQSNGVAVVPQTTSRHGHASAD
ncbi:chromosome partitioning protein [Mycolicibacterium arabiense]|uniref:non-specific protein-tyrosine kinase n=1 Tax=Mycolicibacterium arabiense TaxID=1286181 RepID=A0A7I7RXM4_9MYCO|nr:polysaccharide biosynthesis tyrosine autokinase [Mycolicibacterium arabiense]MCV7374126.1 polysaccharide biosynthesis tyrosine autokinase [Mycolicibacterium arabiense]BBY49372.1 chromosome partitioning protein [Mycolicibacterium arabiense]